MSNSQRQAKASMQAHKEPHLELFMRFSHCLSICLLSPVVGIFPEEAYSSSIEKKSEPPVTASDCQTTASSQTKSYLAGLCLNAQVPTWWQVWGISGNGEVVLRVV